ncbi:LacI family transcriptional regulator [Rathayibacter sp. AY2B3]|uniref:LacI family DNA-binding transcriptional regulator n=1 Tax=Rathayibacter sp. AY2B3 TaxID=2080569 RepID=UPI000CE8CE73|nr:LacI family DNA-binding transcriptional regulator [Rathayibacter sp. AY2B3]PPG50348.1 LacI family transcriptional regulator [Rathayibacter sp. AY2B3]
MKQLSVGDDVPAASDRPATISDVAEYARVSVPTVSRVLTGAARVSPELTRRVTDAIQALDYRPSATARALVRGGATTIAVLSSDTTIYGYSSTIRGIEQAARTAGYSVTIAVIDDEGSSSARAAIDAALRLPLAGVIVLKFDPAGVAALPHLPEHLPVVVASGELDGLHPQAALDEVAGGRAITEHLLQLGHRTVHHVTVPPSRSGTEDGRTTGWRDALRESGAVVPAVVAGTWEAASGVAIGAELAQDPDITAIFCGNDELAMGVIAGLTDAGRTVPDDVSVAGFDDHPLSSIWRPSITTVSQDFDDLGQRAFSLLERRIAGDRTPTLSMTIPPTVLRGSSGPPPQSRRDPQA